MDPTKTTCILWLLFQIPQGLQAKTDDMKEVIDDNLPLWDITRPLYIPPKLHTPEIFMTSLEAKNGRYHRKHNQWQNIFWKRPDITMHATRHLGFPPQTPTCKKLKIMELYKKIKHTAAKR